MKRFPAAIIASALLAGGIILTASPALAACNITKSKGSTWTNGSTTADCNGGVSVQSRIDRYYGGTIQTTYGPQSTGSSYATNSNGINAGNAVRGKTGTGWGDWVYF